MNMELRILDSTTGNIFDFYEKYQNKNNGIKYYRSALISQEIQYSCNCYL